MAEAEKPRKGPSMSFGRILVATDFSDLSAEAVQYAQSLAASYTSELILLHVIDDAPALAMHTMELTTEVVIRDTTHSAVHHLEQFVASHDVRCAGGVRTATRRGNPHEEIVKYADEEGVDLIVMATHGRTGLAHVLLGSVAEKVVQLASVPVLTIKPASVRRSLQDRAGISGQPA